MCTVLELSREDILGKTFTQLSRLYKRRIAAEKRKNSKIRTKMHSDSRKKVALAIGRSHNSMGASRCPGCHGKDVKGYWAKGKGPKLRCKLCRTTFWTDVFLLTEAARILPRCETCYTGPKHTANTPATFNTVMVAGTPVLKCETCDDEKSWDSLMNLWVENMGKDYDESIATIGKREATMGDLFQTAKVVVAFFGATDFLELDIK